MISQSKVIMGLIIGGVMGLSIGVPVIFGISTLVGIGFLIMSLTYGFEYLLLGIGEIVFGFMSGIYMLKMFK